MLHSHTLTQTHTHSHAVGNGTLAPWTPFILLKVEVSAGFPGVTVRFSTLYILCKTPACCQCVCVFTWFKGSEGTVLRSAITLWSLRLYVWHITAWIIALVHIAPLLWWLCRSDCSEQVGFFGIYFPIVYMCCWVLSQDFSYSGCCWSSEVQDYKCRVFYDHVVEPPCVVVAVVLKGHQKLKEWPANGVTSLNGRLEVKAESHWTDTMTTYLQQTALAHKSHGSLSLSFTLILISKAFFSLTIIFGFLFTNPLDIL